MADRPLLMSAPMVRATLAGIKSQTRRILNPAPRLDHFASEQLEDFELRGLEAVEQPDGRHLVYRPRWRAGDRAWIRETWQVARETVDYETGGEYDVFPWDEADMGDPRPYLNGCARHGYKAGLFYRADGEDVNPGVFYPLTGLRGEVLREAEIGWRSPIHMPRWASRLTLTVTEVRVQRLQDISEEDAEAEGCEFEIWDQALATRDYSRPDGWFCMWGTLEGRPGYVAEDRIWRESYRTLWTSLHGPDAWAKNPWVSAISFETTIKNIDAFGESK